MQSFSEIIWMLFLWSALFPIFQQHWRARRRYRCIAALERKRGSRVIALIHRQETMMLLGFPLARFISIEDSEEILRAIRLTPDEMPIDLVLHTPGGLALACEQIACALAAHTGKVTIFVPHYAMSGGTLLALAADEIVMDEFAVLGPLDPQLDRYPAASVLRALERKSPAKVKDEFLILADVAAMAIQQMREVVGKILALKLKPEQAEEAAAWFTAGKFTHDHPIWVTNLKDLGLNVSTQLPASIRELMSLYPQQSQQRPNVQYIPLPYGSTEPSSNSRG